MGPRGQLPTRSKVDAPAALVIGLPALLSTAFKSAQIQGGLERLDHFTLFPILPPAEPGIRAGGSDLVFAGHGGS